MTTITGALKDAQIYDLGTRKQLTGDQESVPPGNVQPSTQQEAHLTALLKGLGEISFEDISVRPFQVERHGVSFGLIPDEPEEDEEPMYVCLEPGNYMAFCEPWDGEYDT